MFQVQLTDLWNTARAALADLGYRDTEIRCRRDEVSRVQPVIGERAVAITVDLTTGARVSRTNDLETPSAVVAGTAVIECITDASGQMDVILCLHPMDVAKLQWSGALAFAPFSTLCR